MTGRRWWQRPWPGGRRGPDELVCRQAVELITTYLEGALGPADQDRFEAHLAACPHCLRYLEQIRLTVAATGRVEPDALGAEARAELVALYRSWSSG